MVSVSIPSFFSDTTGGAITAEAQGRTVSEVIDSLDKTFPGMRARICDDDQLKMFIVITVDGRVAAEELDTPVGPDSEMGILFAMGGG